MTIRDVEVLELLAGEPELLAVADAVAATQRDLARPPHRRLAVRLALVGAAATLLVPSAWAIARSLRGGPPKTPAMIAAAHRDEKTMLARFVAPPHAQRSAKPLTVFAQEKRIFGVRPTSSAPFTRIEYWRVAAPVSTVLAFERAQWPAGSTLLGCPSKAVARRTGCSLGKASGHGVPPNAELLYTFPRIHGLVSSRELRVDLLGEPRGWTSIRIIASNQTWIPYRFRNRGTPPTALSFVLRKGHTAISGRTFTGVYVFLLDPRHIHISRIVCGGRLGGKALPGVARIVSPAHLQHHTGPLAEYACTWNLPANAAGERLRVGSGTGQEAFANRVVISTARTSHRPATTLGSPEYSWIVRK